MRAVERSVLYKMWQTAQGDQEMKKQQKELTPVTASVSQN